MEYLKEMFAQMMKFQMECKHKKCGKTPSTSERKRRKNLKIGEKNNSSSLNCKTTRNTF